MFLKQSFLNGAFVRSFRCSLVGSGSTKETLKNHQQTLCHDQQQSRSNVSQLKVTFGSTTYMVSNQYQVKHKNILSKLLFPFSSYITFKTRHRRKTTRKSKYILCLLLDFPVTLAHDPNAFCYFYKLVLHIPPFHT